MDITGPHAAALEQLHAGRGRAGSGLKGSYHDWAKSPTSQFTSDEACSLHTATFSVLQNMSDGPGQPRNRTCCSQNPVYHGTT